MKKYISFLVFLLPVTAFAGIDTDALCSDDSKWGKIYDSIQVSYPGETVDVHNVYKYYFITDNNSYVSKGETRLYYAVNIRMKGSDNNLRSELYEYDCTTKTPKLLLNLKIYGNGESYYTIDYQNNGNILLAQKYFGISDGGTERIVAYNVYSKKKLFDLKWFSHEGTIDGFVNSQNNWYLYFSSENNDHTGKLYQINKKSKKIVKI